jgi:hypothetical protein
MVSMGWLGKTLLLAVAMGLPMVPRIATAQAADAQAEARALFDEGIALAEADRWPEALSAFRRSASLVPRPSTSYNIANALYRLDRPVEALSELEEYDRMVSVQADESARERGERLRALVREAVGEVVLRVTPSTATLHVDGWPSLLEGEERTLLLNPGAHFIRIARDGYETHRQELQVGRGSRQTYSVELQALEVPIASTSSIGVDESTFEFTPATETLRAGEPVSDDRKPFVKRAGFWVMIGVIAAAGVAAGVAVAVTRKDDSPSCGTTGNCATTQGLSMSF